MKTTSTARPVWLVRACASMALLSPIIALLSSSAEETAPRTVLMAQADGEADDTGGDGPPAGVQVMRVRGRGIDAIETEVPSSLTQFDAAEIEALGAQNISDLSRVTPNVNIIQPGATQSIFFVRGVGLSDFSSNAAGAVTVFQDGVSINAPAIQTGQLFDVEDVSVLRGPQGSGPYRNASGGAITVRSRRPGRNFSANLRATLGRFAADGGKGAHHGLIQDYEGALDAPLVDEWLSSRFSFRFRDAEPFKTNGCGQLPSFDVRAPRQSLCGESFRGTLLDSFANAPDNRSLIPANLPTKVDFDHNWAARGMLMLTPPESDVEILMNMHGSRLNEDATFGQALGARGAAGFGAAGFLGGVTDQNYQDRDLLPELDAICNPDPITGGCRTPQALARQLVEQKLIDRPLDQRPYRGDYDREGRTLRDAYGGFISASFRAMDMDVELLASWDQYKRFQDADNDFTPDRLFELATDDNAWQMYHQAKVGGELAREPFEWELGGFYLQESLETNSRTFVGDAFGTRRDFSQRIRSFGIWGEFAWDFIDELTLEGGVRFNYERKEFRFDRAIISTGRDFAQAPADQDEVWQTPTGKILLRYHIDENASIYAQYNRGFKAGHFNALTTGDTVQPPADPEFNDAWELGMNGRFFDQRLQLSGAFFYYRYEDYQIFLFADSPNGQPVLEIINADQVENYGFEAEARIKPLEGWAPRMIEGLELSGNMSWLNGEFLDFQITREENIFGVIITRVLDFSGDQLQNSPEWKFSASATWAFDLGSWGYIIPRYDFSFQDDIAYGVNEGRGGRDAILRDSFRDFAVGQKAYWLHNLRLTYRTPGGQVELAAWVRNLEDEVYKTFAFDASQVSGVVINFVGQPRTIGLDLTVTF